MIIMYKEEIKNTDGEDSGSLDSIFNVFFLDYLETKTLQKKHLLWFSCLFELTSFCNNLALSTKSPDYGLFHQNFESIHLFKCRSQFSVFGLITTVVVFLS